MAHTQSKTGLSAGMRDMLLSAFFFALMNVCVKIVPRIPSHEVVFFRSLGTLLIAWFLLRQQGLAPHGNHKLNLFLRGFFGSCGLLAYFYTLQNMKLASAVTLQYLNPVFSTWFAIYLLKENVVPKQWLYFGLSFCGVLLIKGFDPQVSTLYLFTGLLAAACSGVSYNFVRKLRSSDPPLVVIFFFSVITLVLVGPYVAWTWVMPRGLEWFWLSMVGVSTYFAQYLMTRAYHAERMAVVANFNYTGVIYALLFGSLIFGERLHTASFVGIALIIAGVILGSRLRPPETEHTKDHEKKPVKSLA